MWDGIAVLGTPGTPTFTANGRLKLTDCEIDDARIGILAGNPVYNTANGLLLQNSTTGGGGGLLEIVGADFLNCYTGMTTRSTGSKTLNAIVTDCNFRSDRPLADPSYTLNSVHHGMQYGARIYENGGITFDNCTFELLDNNTAFGNAVLPKGARGSGIHLINTVADIQNGCVFRNLNFGIDVGNINTDAFVVNILGSHFYGNVFGVIMSAANRTSVMDCEFVMGRSNDLYDLGIKFANSKGFRVQRCTFTSATTGCNNGTCLNTRGIALQDVDGSITTPYPNKVYRNAFWNLSEGAFTSSGTQGLLFQCNSFVGPAPETAPVSSITYSDITSTGGGGITGGTAQTDFLRYEQGDCNIGRPANNLFSHTCGSALDIRVTAYGSTRKMQYAYSSGGTVNPRLIPGGGGGCYSSRVDKVPCNLQWSSYDLDCPAVTSEARSKASLQAEIDTTSDLATRVELIDELLRRYLSQPSRANGGLDSAVAVLDSANLSLYDDARIAVAAVRDNGTSNRAGAAPTPYLSAGGRTRDLLSEARNAHRDVTDGSALDYNVVVRDLLAPFSDAVQIRAALKADAALLGQFEAMAADTLTLGYTVARTALWYYMDYSFVPSNTTNSNKAAAFTASASRPAPVVTLYPNPATGTTQVLCAAWPQGVTSGEVRLYDKFGALVRTQTLGYNSDGTALDLRGLRPGLYGYVVQLGKQTAVRGTLAVQF